MKRSSLLVLITILVAAGVSVTYFIFYKTVGSSVSLIEAAKPNFGLNTDPLAAVKLGDKWGYIDKTGRYAINPQFDDADGFEDGLAIVSIGGKAGYIDKTGKYVINPQFERAGDFEDGLAVVSIGGKTGYIDKTGKYVINPQFDDPPSSNFWVSFDYSGNFQDDLSRVVIAGKWGYIDKTGVRYQLAI